MRRKGPEVATTTVLVEDRDNKARTASLFAAGLAGGGRGSPRRAEGPAVVWATALSLVFCACQSEETKECHRLMASAQGVVRDVESSRITSVKKSLDAVVAAHAACEKAGRSSERDELAKAKNKLGAHYEYLKRKADEPAQRKLTPEELAKLVKEGDPSCPKGQAYKHGGSGKEIRCTGAQPVNMGWKSAEDYFSGRGYKLSTESEPPTLKAEYGSEILVYTFDVPKDTRPPKCLTVYPPPGMSWQEAVARVTGVPPFRVKEDTTIPTRRGALPLRIREAEESSIVHIGDCGT